MWTMLCLKSPQEVSHEVVYVYVVPLHMHICYSLMCCYACNNHCMQPRCSGVRLITCLTVDRICMKVADIVQYGDASAPMVTLIGMTGAKVIISRSDAHYQAGPSSNAPLEKISIPDAEHRRLSVARSLPPRLLRPRDLQDNDFGGSLMTSGA
jgi:hypothetical protein